MAGTEVCKPPVPVRFPGGRFCGKKSARLQTPQLTCNPSSASKLTVPRKGGKQSFPAASTTHRASNASWNMHLTLRRRVYHLCFLIKLCVHDRLISQNDALWLLDWRGCARAPMLEPEGPESGMSGSIPRVARRCRGSPAPERCLQKGPSRGGTSKIADQGVAVRDGTRPNGGGRWECILQEDPGFTWGLTLRPHPRCNPSLTMPPP